MENKYHNPIIECIINGHNFTGYVKSVDIEIKSYTNLFGSERLGDTEVTIRMTMPRNVWQRANESNEQAKLDDGSILLGPGDVDVR